MKLQNDKGQTTELDIRADVAIFYGKEYQIIMNDGDLTRSKHISVNNLIVKEDYVDAIISRFETRNGRVDMYAGFTGFMLLKHDNAFSVLTGWEDRTAYEAWVNSEAFQKSHQKKEDKVNKEGSEFLVEQPVRDHFSVIG